MSRARHAPKTLNAIRVKFVLTSNVNYLLTLLLSLILVRHALVTKCVTEVKSASTENARFLLIQLYCRQNLNKKASLLERNARLTKNATKDKCALKDNVKSNQTPQLNNSSSDFNKFLSSLDQ